MRRASARDYNIIHFFLAKRHFWAKFGYKFGKFKLKNRVALVTLRTHVVEEKCDRHLCCLGEKHEGAKDVYCRAVLLPK